MKLGREGKRTSKPRSSGTCFPAPLFTRLAKLLERTQENRTRKLTRADEAIQRRSTKGLRAWSMLLLERTDHHRCPWHVESNKKMKGFARALLLAGAARQRSKALWAHAQSLAHPCPERIKARTQRRRPGRTRRLRNDVHNWERGLVHVLTGRNENGTTRLSCFHETELQNMFTASTR